MLKFVNRFVIVLVFFPIIVTILLYGSIPLVIIEDSSILVSKENSFYILYVLNIILSLSLLNLKTLLIIISIMPIIYYIFHKKRSKKYDKFDMKLSSINSLVNLLFYVVMYYILLIVIYNSSINGIYFENTAVPLDLNTMVLLFYIALGFYLIVKAILYYNCDINNAVGFNNKYITKNREYKNINKMYSLILSVLSILSIITPFILAPSFVPFVVFLIIFVITLLFLYNYSRKMYRLKNV